MSTALTVVEKEMLEQMRPLARIENSLVAFRDKLQKAFGLNHDVDHEIASILAQVAKNPQLQDCTPKSIAFAAYEAATLGLPVNSLGLAYLTTVNVKVGQDDRGKDIWEKQCKLEIGYMGYIHKILENANYTKVDAEVVYQIEADKGNFIWECGSSPRIIHKPYLGSEPTGPIVAAYAIAHMANGDFKAVCLTKRDLDKIKACSKAGLKGPWGNWEDEMSKKSAVRRLRKMLRLGEAQLKAIAEIEASDDRELPRTFDLPQAPIIQLPNRQQAQLEPIPQAIDEAVQGEVVEPETPQVKTLTPEVVRASLVSQLIDIDLVEKENKKSKYDSLPAGFEQWELSKLEQYVKNRQKEHAKWFATLKQ